jgi:sulfate transport system ATP-binding protein
MSITARHITKRFGKLTVLDDLSVDAPTGALLALLGPSGSGKTTLLRVIAGLEVPDAGTVHYLDDNVTSRSARDRNVGFVFQHYALFRHMTVFENVAFGLRVRKWPAAKLHDRVMRLLHLVRLDGLEYRYPAQLSGGQRQRVALVRALAPDPKVLLLDEPFGALDAKVRQELRQWLRRFHDELHVTSIFVTHDQDEAFEVADHVVVMRDGKVEQSGTPLEVFEHPATPFVMDFLGNVNVFQVRLHRGRAVLGDIEVPVDYGHQEPRDGTVYVRPHELSIYRTPNNGSSLKAKVVHINPAGSVVKVRLLAEEFSLVVNVDVSPAEFSDLGLRANETVYVSPRRVRLFVPDYTI